ncbi:translation initiation factor IF-2 [Sinanaerobacter chloroacetimidivorans]|uniref:Translation initiation factor IF-2 n=1 Tax=Sinanaerobacter chloroacetimidivorans TaxID=2818044 RepID=A0A8J7VXA4_9FIRM|nr:translation initiation factor IF-2 [Sinanaerobacter chloroacetimidivorans]MBR0596759.1 translation initiation factor IF-2 [Sinanaerobacter chloroacetimidivorans]
MSNIKVHELAKELNMSSKDMLDKINVMGIDAKSHMSVLSDMDVIAIRNTVLRGKNGPETKIVKVVPKKAEVQQDKEEVKVVVKAAAHPSVSPEKTAKPQPQRQGQGQQQKTTNENHQHRTVQENQQQRPAQGNQQQRPAQGSQQQRPAQGNQQQRPAQGGQQQRPAQGSQQQRTHQGNQQQRSHQGYQQQRPNQGNPQQRPNQGYQQQRPEHGNQQQRTEHGNQQQNRQGQQRNMEGNPAQQVRHADNKPSSQKNTEGKQPQRYHEKSNAQQKSNEGRPQQHQKSEQKPEQKFPNQKQKQKSSLPPMQQKPVHHKSKPKPAEPEINMEELAPGTKIINVPITVAGFADQIEKSTSAVIMALMKLGIMANINQNLDEDTVVLLGEELGVPIMVGKVAEEVVEEGLELFEDKEEDLKSRPPIITVMGHVDHGKTSLLDAIRKTNVTSTESGGITQHIGASEVYANGHKIVFLDTPGHEAFTAMRARGAHVTDIAVLVVAADDSVKPQTVEAISHAKAANVPIIVAINKMDKPGADPTRVKQDLTEHGILIEEWGGDTICVPVSAKSGEGIDTLLEMILLQAEVLELKANPNRLAMGTVIEARLDKTKGSVATLLVLNGTLQAGMSVVAGTCSGRIKAMTNFKGDTIRKAGPATAVEILGLTEVPEAGDEFNAVKEDKIAREIAENRKQKLREEVMARNSSVTLEQLFSQIQEGEVKELNLIIKGDVQGSVGALTQSLEKLQNENVKVKIIHTGVGTVTESDIMLANTSGAIIIAFNVRPSTAISSMAEREKIEIRTYRVIYDVIDDVEAAMKGMLDPVFKEVVLGKIEIRNTFKVPGVGIIGGAYVLEGKVLRNAEIRLVRDGIVIHEGKISSLKRFKDDVKEVNHGYECGIGIENYNDLKEGDIIEAFKMEEIERK